MFKFLVVLLISLSLYECVASKMTPQRVCENVSGGSKTIRLSVHSKRDQNNEWIDQFTAWTEYSNSSDTMDIDIKHTIFECDGQRIVYIEGAANASTFSTAKDRLRFHARCGKNAAILDHGRAGQKLNNDEPLHSQLFTNRPLRNNEIFEVRLDKKIRKHDTYSLGIGVVTQSPDTVNILADMWNSPVAWMLHHNAVHTNGKRILENYGKDINNLQEGDRVGVMRTELGTLHFFVNGVDQGPAASNIPSPAYGIVELWFNAIKVSIVD